MSDLSMQFFCNWLESVKESKASPDSINSLIDSILKISEQSWDKDFAMQNPGIQYKNFKIRIEEYRPTKGAQSGKHHWNWKGGITPENQKERNSKEYSIWRNSVFKKNHYTCQICGTVGGRLNAHHIKPFARYPDLRFDVNNGITLCEKCHKLVHKRGFKYA